MEPDTNLAINEYVFVLSYLWRRTMYCQSRVRSIMLSITILL
nr:MAG TPA: hypothetical protein [Caudoviricetes sp.]